MTQAETVAVTGAGGFLGGHVCRALLKRGYPVISIVWTGSPRGLPADLASRVEIREGDVLDEASLDAALRGAGVAVHCAALVSIDDSDRAAMTATNAVGARNVLRACASQGVRRLVHVSSVHAYAHMRGTELNPGSALALDSRLAYPAAKAAGHLAVSQAMAEGQIGGCIICPGGIIGPGDDRPSVIGRMVLAMARRKLPMLLSEGFWWSDVRDVADAVASAVSRGTDGRVYFTPGRHARLAQLARLCSASLGRDVTRPSIPYWAAVAGLPVVRAYAAARRLSPLYTSASLRLARDCPASVADGEASVDLGYAARPLEETVQDTLDWFSENGYLQ